jgi:PAS domain-containing protein
VVHELLGSFGDHGHGPRASRRADARRRGRGGGPVGEITGYLGIHRDVSERKRVEEALRDAQQQSETILDSISDTFFAVIDLR